MFAISQQHRRCVVLRNKYRGETPVRRYHAAFLRRRSHTVHRPGRCRRSAAAALGRVQLARQEDEWWVVQRVVSCRARSAPQEGHESRQAQPTHRCRLQRHVDEQNGSRDNGKVDDDIIFSNSLRVLLKKLFVDMVVRGHFPNRKPVFRYKIVRFIYCGRFVPEENYIHIHWMFDSRVFLYGHEKFIPSRIFLIIIFLGIVFSKISTVIVSLEINSILVNYIILIDLKKKKNNKI